MRVMVGHIESSVAISKHGLHEDYGKYWSCEKFGHFVFKNFDGYITGSLGPTGSQIRKIKFLNNFFYFAFAAGVKNSSYGLLN